MIAANQRRSVVMVKTMVAAQKTTLVMEGKEIAIMINNVLDRWYAVKITVLGEALMIAANENEGKRYLEKRSKSSFATLDTENQSPIRQRDNCPWGDDDDCCKRK